MYVKDIFPSSIENAVLKNNLKYFTAFIPINVLYIS